MAGGVVRRWPVTAAGRSRARASAGYLPIVTALCQADGWPVPVAEVRLIPSRRFRCDFVWSDHRLVLEVQGGVFVAGRHSRGIGQVRDMEKFNLLTLAGYRLLQVTPKQVTDGTLRALLAQVFTGGRVEP